MGVQGRGSSYKKHEIEKLASDLLERHGITSAPIDPVVLADAHGIMVHNAVFAEDGISGLIAKRGDNVTLLVNANDAPVRKRFTIAHELGHLLLHLNDTQHGDFIDTDLLRTADPFNEVPLEHKREEVQANQFAAALLMPERLVKQAFRVTGDLGTLSDMFKVSQTAMSYRLAGLGLEL